MITKNRDAFTLIELLTVIAIIGILAAILIPTIGAAKIAAKKAQSKTQFSQWSTSMNLFKQEYGYYPTLGTGATNSAPGSLKGYTAAFLDALAAQTYSGGVFTAETTSSYGNTKLLSFYSPSNSDLGLQLPTNNQAYGQLQDAFGNVDIKMCVDANGTGILTAPTAAVTVGTGTTSVTPATPTTTTIQAGVIFYSAGAGRSATDIVYSWQ